MRELLVTLFICVATYLLLRMVRPRRSNTYPILPSQQLQAFDVTGHPVYKWPSLGLFQLGTADSSGYQAALKLVTNGTSISPVGTPVIAQLHTNSSHSEIWKPVEIRVHGQRVGFLLSGDARRFQRRLANQGHARQTTRCDALITLSSNHYGIRLDLKAFGH